MDSQKQALIVLAVLLPLLLPRVAGATGEQL